MPKEKSTRAKKKKGGDVMRKGRTNKNVEGPVEFQEQTTMETSTNNGFEGEMDVSPRDEPSGFRMENSRETIRGTQGIDIPNMVNSYNNVIGLNVSQEIKNKIVSGQYVELAKLLINSNEPQKQTIVMVNGELQTSEKNSKKINNIEQWTDAFIIFCSIYLEAHPAKTLEILKYMNDVRLAASRSGNLGFKEYDQQFRLKMAKNPTKPWGEVDSELWLMFVLPAVKTLSAAPTYQSQSKKCYNYNYQGSCFRSPCAYLHVCIKCGGQHPINNCQSKNISTQGEGFSNFRGQGNYRFSRGQYQNTRGRGGSQFRGQRGTF